MTGTDADAGAANDPAARLLAIVEGVVGELKPGRRGPPVRLDSSLDGDLGLDSLARVELAGRIEAAFGRRLSDEAAAGAASVRDLLDAVTGAAATEGRAGGGAVAAAAPVGTGLPAEARDGGLAAAPPAVQTLGGVLAWHAARHPDRLHLRLYADDDEGSGLTYGALYAQALAVAGGLQAAGIGQGEPVALMLPTGLPYFAAFFGTLLAGAICVPIYPPSRNSRIKEHVQRHLGILANAGARALIVPGEAVALARSLQAQSATLRTVATVEELAGRGEPLREVRVAAEDPALLQYTSGSTGAPKGVTLTNANLLANIRAMSAALAAGPSDVFVSWLPLYHDMGLIGAWLGSLHQGVPLVLMSPLAFLARPGRWLHAIHRFRGTISGGPNFGYELLLRHVRDEELGRLDLSSWRVAFNGAEPVSAETIERFCARFAAAGFRREALCPVYGLAENAVGLAFPPLGRGPLIDSIDRDELARSRRAVPASGDGALRLVACGHPLPDHDIRIVDATGFELPERREGRLQFRGPSATSGYWRNEEATRRLLDGDWRESGDLAYLAGGDVYITAREKDLIIRGGRNVHPADIEAAVGGLAGLMPGRIAAFGDAGAGGGSERLIVMAETRKREAAALDALRAEINGRVAEIAGSPPDDVALVPANTIPRTSSGKIRRQASREVWRRGLADRPPAGASLASLRRTAASAGRRRRQGFSTAAGILFAGWAWAALALLAPLLWIAMLLPSRSWRWGAVHRTARLLFLITATPLRVRGGDNLARGNAVLVANHASYLDVLALAATLPRPVAFVAKAELGRRWYSRWPLQRIGVQFVERFDRRRGLQDYRAVASAASDGRSPLFFPEGTFRRAPGLMPFRLGAFLCAVEAGVPVIPLVVTGTRAILPSDSWFPRHGRVEVTVAQPIAPGGSGWRAALALRDRTRVVMLPLTGERDAGDAEPAIFATGLSAAADQG